MAFIRSYMVRARMQAGDPFLGIKLPRIKLLKTLAKGVGAAASIAGPGKFVKLAKLGIKAVGVGLASGIGNRMAQQVLGQSLPGAPGTGVPYYPSRLSSGPTINVTPQGQVMIDESRRQVAAMYRKRYRRMNVTNMKALTRSIRRVKRFEKVARQCVTLSHHVRVKKGARGRCK